MVTSGSGQPPSDPAADGRANYDYRTDADTVERPELVAALESQIAGDVRFDSYSRQLYATDASAYEVTPIGVVFPRSTADVASVMAYCADHEIPVLPRGGGTSLAGQTVNEAVVLDFTRYMDTVVDIDPDGREAVCQPGTILGDLNHQLEEYGLKFAPDPSTADRSAIGGAIGNNTTGAHSLLYGKTDAYVEELEVVLADGTVTRLGEMTLEELRERADPDGTLEERFYAQARRIIEDEREHIEDAYPSIKRNVSGYNLDVLIEEAETGTVNLARIMVGSEGTLGIVTEATVSLEPLPAAKAVGLLTYRGLVEAMEDVEAILAHDPAAVEVLDEPLLDLAHDLEEFKPVLEPLPEGTKVFLLVEFYADSAAAAQADVEALLDDRVDDIAFDGLRAFDPAEQERFWKMRKASTPILLSRTTDAKHIAFIEDIAVPPENLPEYIADFQAVFEEHDTFGSFYAHAGPGCIHVRPLINTKTEEGVVQMESIADAATDLAVKYGGSVSGEHGDGRARTQWNKKLYGEHLWQVFRELKTAVDPDWLLNPGTVCGDVDMTENLRFDPDYEFEAGFEPTLEWDNDNGFQGMVELCHGCGGCRGDQHTMGGVMCPTYRASQEEITSTRGRANLLRQAMSGDLPADEQFDVEFMHEVLDLCIGCKGCARDCPSEVDMAKLKAEVEHEYHSRHGATLRDKLFANIDTLSAIGSATAPLSNWLSNVPGARWLLERTVGIAADRRLPTFHRETLVEWFDDRGGSTVPAADADRRVLLFPDTYTNYNNPAAGRAAVEVLETLGCHVAIPRGLAGSGRPAHSKGFLDQARETAETTVATLAPKIRNGWDVVVVEPSDAVMLQSDYRDLLGTEGVETVAANTYGIMEYLDLQDIAIDVDPTAVDASLVYHGHCHQKATKKAGHAATVLRDVGYDVTTLDSGCCGMAGSFGYEAEHYSMSKAIARILYDQVDAADGTVIAPGASCRSQLRDHVDTKPPHPVEKLADVVV
ncbi:MAG: FAD-linked oxidase C-terminal domain-containing protein [Halobacteriales archaeon]|nr:FAD-linked oxidase C-terminal domain-containing protein [Halobacteriales archaeon]